MILVSTGVDSEIEAVSAHKTTAVSGGRERLIIVIAYPVQ